jgi:hypothetical protein
MQSLLALSLSTIQCLQKEVNVRKTNPERIISLEIGNENGRNKNCVGLEMWIDLESD